MIFFYWQTKFWTTKALLGVGGGGCQALVVKKLLIVSFPKCNKKTCITFFDLKDAFGSVPHKIIDLTLEKNIIPPKIIESFHKLLTYASADLEEIQQLVRHCSWQ